MHISEPGANPTLIDCANKVYEFNHKSLRSIGQYYLPQNSNFEVDSILHYKKINYTLIPI